MNSELISPCLLTFKFTNYNSFFVKLNSTLKMGQVALQLCLLLMLVCLFVFCFLLDWRWWTEVEGDADRVGSVLYTVSTNTGSESSESEIVLHLRKEDNHEEIINTEVGSSGRQYALVPEGLWLRALKR